jgi:hypothetical protein
MYNKYSRLTEIHRQQSYSPIVTRAARPLGHVDTMEVLMYCGASCEWACSPMVGRSSETLLTRIQILVLAPFPGFIPGFSGVMC